MAKAEVKAPARVPASRWHPATQVAFRFCVVYLGLYALATQIVGGIFLLPGFALPALGTVWPMRPITSWVAQNVFGVDAPLITGNSGDIAFIWVQTAWLLALSVLATGVWSWYDHRRASYEELHKWFRLFVRFGLAAQMFYFGMAKVIPTQFRPPALITLVEPVGHLSLSDMLWVSIGSATGYQIFTGIAEVAGGLLLLLPQTTPLGALICLGDMMLVFTLNMAYDFGLKQISLHLILMSLFLLAPDIRRLANVLLFDRPAGASVHPPLFRSPKATRNALIAQVVFGLYLLGMFTNLSVGFWYEEGAPGSPKSPLYGIWDVKELSIDGEVRLPELNDYDRRWRRAIFDSPRRLIFQRTDDSFATFGVQIDTSSRTLALTKGSSRSWGAALTYERPNDRELIVTGRMDGHDIRMRLELVGLDTFRLLNSRFRWVRPPDPFAG